MTQPVIDTPPVDGEQLRRCQCRDYVDATTGVSLSCDGVTYRKFAPGHDARLKGFLIQAGRSGHQIKVRESGETVTPVEAASRYGFAHQVRAGVSRSSPAEPATPKAAATSPDTLVARVGRWSYRGRVKRENGRRVFVYRDRKGNERRSTDFEPAAA